MKKQKRIEEVRNICINLNEIETILTREGMRAELRDEYKSRKTFLEKKLNYLLGVKGILGLGFYL